MYVIMSNAVAITCTTQQLPWSNFGRRFEGNATVLCFSDDKAIAIDDSFTCKELDVLKHVYSVCIHKCPKFQLCITHTFLKLLI